MYCMSLETESGSYDDSNIRDNSKNVDTVNVDTITFGTIDVDAIDVSKFYVNNENKLKLVLLNIYIVCDIN